MLYIFIILIPSLILLYSLQDTSIFDWCSIPYKIIRNQCYWTYEYLVLKPYVLNTLHIKEKIQYQGHLDFITLLLDDKSKLRY
jgi:hypothetical protein